MSWKGWMTACLVAALLGVSIGAVYAAVTGRFDGPVSSSTATLPASAEQAAPPVPIARFAPAARSRAATSTAAAPRPKASRAKAEKPPKEKDQASDGDRKDAGKDGKGR